MDVIFGPNNFLIMDGEILLSISHHFFAVFAWIMLSVYARHRHQAP